MSRLQLLRGAGGCDVELIGDGDIGSAKNEPNPGSGVQSAPRSTRGNRWIGTGSKLMASRGAVGKLTDDDLDQSAGNRDQLEGKIQERYGIEKNRPRRDLDDWYSQQRWD